MTIECFFESLDGRGRGHTIVAVDVIRATTTAVTGVAQGRRCFPAASLEDALRVAEELDNPLLVGELGGEMPYGFDITNSPATLADRTDADRPMVLLSTSGTRLITAAGPSAFVACLRNYGAQIEELAQRDSQIKLVGAGTRGEFREEDEMCCAWMAEGLLARGWEPGDESTLRTIERWSGAQPDAFVGGKSTEYLRNTDQLRDLDFILEHVNDLDDVFTYEDGEIRRVHRGRSTR